MTLLSVIDAIFILSLILVLRSEFILQRRINMELKRRVTELEDNVNEISKDVWDLNQAMDKVAKGK